MKRLTALLLAALLFAGAASAQAPAPVRVRGSIDRLDGLTLVVNARDGSKQTIRLADNYAVGGVVAAKLSDITAGKFVGTAAMPQADGSLKALEVLIFPDALRGTGEGHFPWDLQPQSTMTNANVGDVVSGGDGPILLLRYKDGEKKVIVPAGAPIVTFAPADRSALQPGAHVFITARREADGSLSAPRVTVGLNGLVPPM